MLTKLTNIKQVIEAMERDLEYFEIEFNKYHSEKNIVLTNHTAGQISLLHAYLDQLKETNSEVTK